MFSFHETMNSHYSNSMLGLYFRMTRLVFVSLLSESGKKKPIQLWVKWVSLITGMDLKKYDVMDQKKDLNDLFVILFCTNIQFTLVFAPVKILMFFQQPLQNLEFLGYHNHVFTIVPSFDLEIWRGCWWIWCIICLNWPNIIE